MADTSSWPIPLRLHEVQRASPTLELEADAGRRSVIAKALDLLELKRFNAQVRVTPWLDGAQVSARWAADIVQTCGVTLDPFETPLTGEFVVRVVPPGSPAAPAPTEEVSIDPDAEDPPELLEGDELDVGGYLVEHLALEIDPFPRKPGAAFAPPPEERPASPFTLLKTLNVGSGGMD